MNTPHTPGPWKVVKRGEIESADGSPIADVAVLVQWNTTDGIKEEAMPWKANARLMAAAPELLEIVKAFLGHDIEAGNRATTKAKKLIKQIEEDETRP